MQIIKKAFTVLEQGGIIGYPTETFYGLGVKYNDADALERLYMLKKRPVEKAMPVIIGDVSALKLITPSVNKNAEKLIKKFWPGPLTLIFYAKDDLSEFLTANTGKVAVRVPGDSFALYLSRSLAYPITATSANISTFPAADKVEDVIRYFNGNIDLIIDCGKSPGGLASTIVDVTEKEIRILRKGKISEKDIFKALSV